VYRHVRFCIQWNDSSSEENRNSAPTPVKASFRHNSVCRCALEHNSIMCVLWPHPSVWTNTPQRNVYL
jgi:hypothetical protein